MTDYYYYQGDYNSEAVQESATENRQNYTSEQSDEKNVSSGQSLVVDNASFAVFGNATKADKSVSSFRGQAVVENGMQILCYIVVVAVIVYGIYMAYAYVIRWKEVQTFESLSTASKEITNSFEMTEETMEDDNTGEEHASKKKKKKQRGKRLVVAEPTTNNGLYVPPPDDELHEDNENQGTVHRSKRVAGTARLGEVESGTLV